MGMGRGCSPSGYLRKHNWQNPGLPRESRPWRPEVVEKRNIVAVANHTTYIGIGLGTTNNDMDGNMDGVLGLEMTRTVMATERGRLVI